MKISKTGFWENPTAEGHAHDEGLAKALVEFFKTQSKDYPILFVIDIGCGDGYYTNYINNNSGEEVMCWGIDGNPHTLELAGPNTFVGDLSGALPFHHRYDWALCLEVGEHIPAEYEYVFLKNLDMLNRDGIILSWAIPGQGGDGHVNCQTNEDIIRKIEAFGFLFQCDETQKLRDRCATYPANGYWFKNTLMVFRRRKPGLCSLGYDMGV